MAEITSQLQSLRTDEGINALLEGLKNKKRVLKIQDEGIKSLVQQINALNELVNNLQLENETMRYVINNNSQHVYFTVILLTHIIELLFILQRKT